MAEEIWKDIDGFEGLYQVSSWGRVKSLERTKVCRGNRIFPVYETILKEKITKTGYCTVCLYKNSKRSYRNVHTIVWDAFGDKPRNGLELQVDHVDNNKLNNRRDNLQLLPAIENVYKARLNLKNKISKYVGVTYRKYNNKWQARITINKKRISLGHFLSEEEAHQAYESALEKIKKSQTKDI